MNHARSERAELSDLLVRLGPDAPTLCEGWTAFDLAAHLVLRERRLDAAPGIALAPLAGYTARVQESLKAGRGFGGLVELVRSGPGGVYGLVPGLDAAVNTMEMFVHHEDLRRAQRVWEPRELPADLEELFWKRVRAGRGLFLRKAPVGVVLHRIGGGVALGGAKEGPKVEVTGPASELLLFCFGRQAHARVGLNGDEGSVARLMDASLGV
ncbi:TIGR03085 family metal-binding protein [Planomonospora parontospora]|uniref:TIGR03085 family metal-binding protein n=1 Tax=Planomonospora parontospora TaxID=58119 RepID=UPI00167157F4|nr:TIGR03085 family metal-binding protein [Planomonospora parontospora]GGL19990.1 TIGR03085 family protein [Planomonospora parontospora subsp. antibiotica]GII13653.1 TIGR03085 family protein [Planomonospora parontospora subsp. antibiotica]